MSDNNNSDAAILELTVKITEVAGDIKVIRQFMEQSEKDKNATSRRLDKQDEELDKIKLQIAEHKTTMRVLKALFAAAMSLVVTASAVLALILH